MSRPTSRRVAIVKIDALVDTLKRTVAQTREAQDYNRGMDKYAQIIKSVIKTGTLAEKIETERALQERDLVNAAGNPALVKEAEDAIINFKAGLVVYDRLTTEPAEYRKYAAGFVPRHKTPGGLPKDEMHHVLKSQISRETQRDASRHNTTGEEALVKARQALLHSILSDYEHIQSVVLAGDSPPRETARGG